MRFEINANNIVAPISKNITYVPTLQPESNCQHHQCTMMLPRAPYLTLSRRLVWSKGPLISKSAMPNLGVFSVSSNWSAAYSTPKAEMSKTPDESYMNEVAKKVLSCSSTKTPFVVTPVDRTKRTEKPGAKSWMSKDELRKIAHPYWVLTKPRLTALVMLSSICSYALSPCTVTLPELLFLTVGTTLASGAANAINMGREPEFDGKMTRTMARPVVRGLVSPANAFRYAAVSGTLGVSLLYFGVNPTVAALGGLNIILYSWIYTSLKRRHIINTWVGALVGAIPPLMGWAASSSLAHPGAWVLAGLLYAWQFPHFNALSHNVREEYHKAGYKMAAYENPTLNARVGFRYALLMFPLCFGLSYYEVCDWVFPFDSALLNGWLAFWAYKFWWQQKQNYAKGSPTAEGMQLANIYAKKMFWGSVWHLPGILVLAMLHKKGQWDRFLDFGGNKDRLQPA
ncbi:hypothetical protein BABINDRAFT_159108 [Babjeviella inositovora NRRL Y-12698]|uniref:Protoheme IX farnesyltransferase, mitochondrial n=1 Tax=Babjeviella inositovora NRRL Y-12698 TaxID=984486 RepID=A0A1E3QZN4_9ASCO|nr:uncharacterized protein BABINDRAFT_159108 [Babjeviella inositovora NRRL Y-12698]ODQ82542.1 hypothetical protein BABINDRAFT_159108 [Babjeviella inositovora NRRL Y-12698]